ncbi:MAG: hypothetical protein ACM33B_09330 [Pseudomonadota bacterium]
MTNEQALAQNEALFREVNERIAEITDAHDVSPSEPVSFVCECSALSCGGQVTLTLEEYRRARARRRVFVVVPGHERLDIERVVERAEGWSLVEKLGEAGVVADETAS